jgi:hypothetical protein
MISKEHPEAAVLELWVELSGEFDKKVYGWCRLKSLPPCAAAV